MRSAVWRQESNGDHSVRAARQFASHVGLPRRAIAGSAKAKRRCNAKHQFDMGIPSRGFQQREGNLFMEGACPAAC